MADPQRKRFEVQSARNAEFFRSDHPWVAISVSSTDQFPMLDGENRVGLLQLVFEDITDAGKPGSPASYAACVGSYNDGLKPMRPAMPPSPSFGGHCGTTPW
jgi:hypothetical protein